ncbi:ArnT family glycosyltransferase [Thermodesulfobacteriota bacterium]
MNNRYLSTVVMIILSATLLFFLGVEFVLNLTPPISRDALVHHLAVPKLWLKHGGFYETPWANYSYYPMYINLLYLVCLYFYSDCAPKFIHLGFGLGTGIMIYVYLKQRLGRNWGLLGMVIFVSTPIVVWLSTSAYIDLGMTFFVTASILAIVKWRDSAHERPRWLFISSCCMGIAVGSKYNALIAFVIVNLLLMHGYVRDTKHQAATLRYGTIFFAVTILVASPWYLKNYFLTKNPFYPLFNSFFQSLQHQPIQKVVQDQVKKPPGTISLFQMRKVFFEETFWETLFIPIRMFFQGKDDSYRYFQGVLNPILVLFAPLILLDRKYGRDKILFVVFSVFFIGLAYFLTLQQVRYILPVLPFLSILAVFGIKNLSDKLKDDTFFSFFAFHKHLKSMARVFLFAGVTGLLCLNFAYITERVRIIQPFPYLFRQETRPEFLRRHLMHYPAVEYINHNLPEDAKIFLMFLGRRGYYLDKSYMNESSFGMNTVNNLVGYSTSETEFHKFVQSMGVTHVLVRTDLFHKFLADNFSKAEIARFLNLVKTHWKLIYEFNGYAVWDIQEG